MPDLSANALDVLNDLPLPVFITDARGLVLFSNQALANTTGQRGPDLQGASLSTVIHPDDLSAAQAVWGRAAAEDRPDEREIRLRLADGTYVWFCMRSRARPGGAGSATVLSTCHDIHALKVAETRAQQLQDLTASLADARDTGGVLALLPKAAQVLGATRAVLSLLPDHRAAGGLTRTFGLPDLPATLTQTLLADVTGGPGGEGSSPAPALADRLPGAGHHLMVQPLGAAGVPLGVLAVAIPGAAPPGPAERTLGLTVAGVLAQSLRRARQHEAEEAARQHERALLDAAPTLMWTSRPQEDVARFNRAWAEYTGLNVELKHGALERAVHPQDLGALRDAARRVLAGLPYSGELRLRRADGAYRWHHVSLRPLGPDEWLGVATDMHEQHEAEQRLHLTLEASGLGVWTLDLSTGTVQRSPETQRMLGFETTVDTTDTFYDRVHPDDRAEVQETFTRAIAGEGPASFRVDHRFLRGDGTSIWVEQLVRVERNEQGQALRLLGVTADITARKQTETRLRLLAGAGETLAENLNLPETLSRLTSLAVPGLADWCAVYLPQPDGTLHPAAYTHRDVEKQRLAEKYLALFPQRADDFGGVARAYRENKAVVLPSVSDDLLDALPITDRQRTLLKAMAFGSALIVPLAAHGRVLGVLSLMLHRGGRAFGPEDVPFVQELARRAALALENARLYAQAQSLNAELEARVGERTAALEARNRTLESFADLSRDLSLELDPDALVGRAQEILVSLLTGGASTYYEPGAGTWTLRSSRGEFRNPALLPALRAGLPRGATPNLDRPLDTQQPYYQRRYDPASVPVARELLKEVGATASLPVMVGGEPRGVLVVGTYEPRAWAPEERAMLETTARALGLALERSDALRERQQERTFLAGILQNLAEGIVACDARGHLTLFNEASRTLHGQPLAPLPPEAWAAHYHLYRPDGVTPLPLAEIPLYRAYQGEQVQDAEIVIRPEGGEARLVLSFGSPVTGSRGERLGAVVVLRDVTEQDASERALRDANEHLQRSNQELEQFAYIASHDLQTPTRAVTSFAELLQNRYGPQLDDRALVYLQQIIRGGRRMKRLVDDLLAFSRVNTQQGALTPVSSEGVLRAALEVLGPDLEAAAGVVTHGPLPVILGDQDQLTRLLVNLIGNAVKYRRPGTPPRVHLTADPDGTFWRFAVQDNGVGIGEAYLDRIFEPFQRLHAQDDIEGSGLGLPVSRKIVERHGGRLWVTSAPGEGSTFFFTLPGAAHRPVMTR
ncbi:PAS domain S-box protein (plasmid) [Deinococcus taeanensis]|uniref:PAS domain S-box protein n=1 Tax=Deinococcus taeanensis TaxID=2737050 RepID=UPI001CDC49F8|nr:PAS domain S-box protein [Deinococcus taeanensis]UBV45070.1 PAS domain S-box protein [Deinococcus taeanensis]